MDKIEISAGETVQLERWATKHFGRAAPNAILTHRHCHGRARIGRKRAGAGKQTVAEGTRMREAVELPMDERGPLHELEQRFGRLMTRLADSPEKEAL
jgi:hypothetical protein